MIAYLFGNVVIVVGHNCVFESTDTIEVGFRLLNHFHLVEFGLKPKMQSSRYKILILSRQFCVWNVFNLGDKNTFFDNEFSKSNA